MQGVYEGAYVPDNIDSMVAAQGADKWCIRQHLHATEEPTTNRCHINNGLIYRFPAVPGTRPPQLLIPRNMRFLEIGKFHWDSLRHCHRSRKQTYEHARRQIYCDDMRKIVGTYVQCCLICQERDLNEKGSGYIDDIYIMVKMGSNAEDKFAEGRHPEEKKQAQSSEGKQHHGGPAVTNERDHSASSNQRRRLRHVDILRHHDDLPPSIERLKKDLQVFQYYNNESRSTMLMMAILYEISIKGDDRTKPIFDSAATAAYKHLRATTLRCSSLMYANPLASDIMNAGVELPEAKQQDRGNRTVDWRPAPLEAKQNRDWPPAPLEAKQRDRGNWAVNDSGRNRNEAPAPIEATTLRCSSLMYSSPLAPESKQPDRGYGTVDERKRDRDWSPAPLEAKQRERGSWPTGEHGRQRDVATSHREPQPRHQERRRREPNDQKQPYDDSDNRPSKRGPNHIAPQEQPRAPQAEQRAQTIDLTGVTRPRQWNQRRAEVQQVIRDQLARLHMLPSLEGGFHAEELRKFRINSLEAELIWWQSQHPM